MHDDRPAHGWPTRLVYALLVLAGALALFYAQARLFLYLWDTPPDVLDASHRWTVAGVVLVAVAAAAATRLPAARVLLTVSAGALGVINALPVLLDDWDLALLPGLLTAPLAIALAVLALCLTPRPAQ